MTLVSESTGGADFAKAERMRAFLCAQGMDRDALPTSITDLTQAVREKMQSQPGSYTSFLRDDTNRDRFKKEQEWFRDIEPGTGFTQVLQDKYFEHLLSTGMVEKEVFMECILPAMVRKRLMPQKKCIELFRQEIGRNELFGIHVAPVMVTEGIIPPEICRSIFEELIVDKFVFTRHVAPRILEKGYIQIDDDLQEKCAARFLDTLNDDDKFGNIVPNILQMGLLSRDFCQSLFEGYIGQTSFTHVIAPVMIDLGLVEINDVIRSKSEESMQKNAGESIGFDMQCAPKMVQMGLISQEVCETLVKENIKGHSLMMYVFPVMVKKGLISKEVCQFVFEKNINENVIFVEYVAPHMIENDLIDQVTCRLAFSAGGNSINYFAQHVAPLMLEKDLISEEECQILFKHRTGVDTFFTTDVAPVMIEKGLIPNDTCQTAFEKWVGKDRNFMKCGAPIMVDKGLIPTDTCQTAWQKYIHKNHAFAQYVAPKMIEKGIISEEVCQNTWEKCIHKNQVFTLYVAPKMVEMGVISKEMCQSSFAAGVWTYVRGEPSFVQYVASKLIEMGLAEVTPAIQNHCQSIFERYIGSDIYFAQHVAPIMIELGLATTTATSIETCEHVFGQQVLSDQIFTKNVAPKLIEMGLIRKEVGQSICKQHLEQGTPVDIYLYEAMLEKKWIDPAMCQMFFEKAMQHGGRPTGYVASRMIELGLIGTTIEKDRSYESGMIVLDPHVRQGIIDGNVHLAHLSFVYENIDRISLQDMQQLYEMHMDVDGIGLDHFRAIMDFFHREKIGGRDRKNTVFSYLVKKYTHEEMVSLDYAKFLDDLCGVSGYWHSISRSEKIGTLIDALFLYRESKGKDFHFGDICTSLKQETKKSSEIYEDIARCIRYINIIYGLKGERARGNILKKQMDQENIWTQEYTKEYITRITQILQEQINEVFLKKFNIHETATEAIDIPGLIESWGDIDVLATLVSNISSSYQELHKKLKEVLVHLASHTFTEYKYSPGEYQEDQLEYLHDYQKKIWKKPYKRLSYTASRGDTIKENIRSSIQNSYNQIFTGQEAHACMFLDETQENDLPITHNQLNGWKENPGSIYTLFGALRETMSDPKTFSETIRIINFIADGTYAQLDGVMGGKLDELRSELRGVREKLKSYNKERKESGSAVVWSIISDHPKTLASVGALTAEYSCQDYRNCGSAHLRSLPGYMIDANVQVGLSWEITQKMIGCSQEEFEIFQEYAKSPNGNEGKVSMNFDEAKMMMTVRIGGKKYTFPMGLAKSRHILKCGWESDTKKGKIGWEREYSGGEVSIGAQAASEQIKRLMRQKGEDMGVDVGGDMYVAASKSPEGHYSDSKGGIQKGGYVCTLGG